MTAIVIVNRHEPEHEVATRLLELAEEKGHDARTVETQRGEHDAALSFRVPEDVAEAFNAERGDRWSSTPTDSETESSALPGDAYAVDNLRAAEAARQDNAVAAENQNTPTERTSRPGKAKTE